MLPAGNCQDRWKTASVKTSKVFTFSLNLEVSNFSEWGKIWNCWRHFCQKIIHPVWSCLWVYPSPSRNLNSGDVLKHFLRQKYFKISNLTRKLRQVCKRKIWRTSRTIFNLKQTQTPVILRELFFILLFFFFHTPDHPTVTSRLFGQVKGTFEARIGELSTGLSPPPPHPRPDPGIGSKNFLGGRMVKKFLMGCLKNYFRVLKFFGCRTGDRPDPVPPTPVTVPWTLPLQRYWTGAPGHRKWDPKYGRIK